MRRAWGQAGAGAQGEFLFFLKWLKVNF
jgi:hypothetical protein